MVRPFAARTLAILVALAAACRAPAQPTPELLGPVLAAPAGPSWLNLVGTWSGWYRVTSCTTTSTGCGGSAVGMTVPCSLTIATDLTHSAATFKGVTPGRATFIATMTGSPASTAGAYAVFDFQ